MFCLSPHYKDKGGKKLVFYEEPATNLLCSILFVSFIVNMTVYYNCTSNLSSISLLNILFNGEVF